MGEEDDWGWFWWQDVLEEEEREQRICPKCESRRTWYDEDRKIWICLDCDYEWKDE